LAPHIRGGIVLPMPMAVILHPLNAMLADPASPAYETAAAAVARATSCEGAVRQLGVLDDQSPEVVREADAVFAAMPADVDEAILGALRDGFGRGSPMELRWQEDTSAGEPGVAHRIEDQGDRLHIHLIAPHGDRFV
jgi:hypothetical protein